MLLRYATYVRIVHTRRYFASFAKHSQVMTALTYLTLIMTRYNEDHDTQAACSAGVGQQPASDLSGMGC